MNEEKIKLNSIIEALSDYRRKREKINEKILNLQYAKAHLIMQKNKREAKK